ncbi:intraflagellar transport protein 25 homolog [Bufo gargarizans]|uniref:intraflagellar transport protein 25 homolog n=1 Tax=Bufo gargarizans TaxID=30331 RepID=UPI001CF2E3F9|nr:intraflagellar transport protein 25 homolog [Bufo gargarizans]
MTRAGNLCLSSTGAQVSLATSSDDRHPAEHIIDGNPETFWTTTGTFPQEFIISMNGLQKIGKIIIDSSLIRSLKIYTSASKEPTNFETCVERDLEHVEEQFQTEEIAIPGVQAIHLRFVILSGYDQFVAVRSVSAESMI